MELDKLRALDQVRHARLLQRRQVQLAVTDCRQQVVRHARVCDERIMVVWDWLVSGNGAGSGWHRSGAAAVVHADDGGCKWFGSEQVRRLQWRVSRF